MTGRRRLRKLPAAAVVALSILIAILLGTALLCIPAATSDGSTDFLSSLFTATSATCVTGLIVAGTGAHWSYFGQAVILLLIQIGGLGFITIISIFMLYVQKHASLSQRKLAMQSAGSVDLAGTRSLVKYILIGTFAFEFTGAFALSFAFVPDMGWGEGIWQAVFTSVSAFCNAGFTLTDKFGGDSLGAYISNPLVNITVILLIIIGGLGFFVWRDVVKHRHHFKKYSFHSKIVLSVTGVLLILGWALFMAFEWNNPNTIGDRDAGTKILASLFMSVTPRTAGFNTVSYGEMTGAGNALTILYMFVGGSPGSTAGGIKTTTVAVFALSALATARRYEETHLFKRKFERDTSSQAAAVIALYLLVGICCVFAIAGIEGTNNKDIADVTFEVVSAIGTVGLTCGITSGLHAASKVILIMLMFFGRVGGYSFMLLFSDDKKPVTISRVAEKILIG